MKQVIQKRGRAKQESGFTLIELLVTLTVTVIGLSGLLSLHMTTLKGNQTASRAAEATTVAQRTVEELRAVPIDGAANSLVASYGALPIDNVAMTPALGRAGMEYNRRIWAREMTSVSEDLVLIRVEIEWMDDGADPNGVDDRYKHNISLEIIRTRLEAL